MKLHSVMTGGGRWLSGVSGRSKREGKGFLEITRETLTGCSLQESAGRSVHKNAAYHETLILDRASKATGILSVPASCPCATLCKVLWQQFRSRPTVLERRVIGNLINKLGSLVTGS